MATAQTTGGRVGGWLSALVVLSIIGFPALIVFAVGVWFLVYVARLVLAIVFALAAAGSFLFARSGHIADARRPV